MQQFYSLLRQTLPLCTTLIIHWQSVKLYISLICLYTSTALGNVVPRCHGGFHGHVLFWQQFLGTIWKTQSLIKKKINPRLLFFILPSSKNFLLRLGCFFVNILLRGWKFPEFCLETNTNRIQYNLFRNTARFPFQILRIRLIFSQGNIRVIDGRGYGYD